jgi:hypothetical protein
MGYEQLSSKSHIKQNGQNRRRKMDMARPDRCLRMQLAAVTGMHYLQQHINGCQDFLMLYKGNNSNKKRVQWLEGLANAILADQHPSLTETEAAYKHKNIIKKTNPQGRATSLRRDHQT